MDLKTNVYDYLKTYYNSQQNIDNIVEEICNISKLNEYNCNKNQEISQKYYVKKIVEKYFNDIETFNIRQEKNFFI